MAGTKPTVKEIVPLMEKKMVYFEVTLDGSAKADFTDHSSVEMIVDAVDYANRQTAEAVTAISGTEVTFTNNSNKIVGVAVVKE